MTVLIAEHEQIARAVVRARHRTGLPVVFGGLVTPAGVALTGSAGLRTGPPVGLVVAPDAGLGGRAVQVRRPVAVHEYTTAPTITHEYDRQIEAEGLVALVAVPVLVGPRIRAVLYGSVRRPGAIGDRPTVELINVARDLGQTLDTEERLSSRRAAESHAAHAHIRSIIGELGRVAQDIPDASLRAEIVARCERIGQMPLAGGQIVAGNPGWTPRQLHILTLAASGCGNADIAELLGMSVDAVKSHLRTAMRKLGVHSRHAAVSAARSSGVLA